MSRFKRPSPALLVASLALFVALGGVGLSATGGNFILGAANTADQQTQLTGTVNGNPQLRVNNGATSGAARAIVGKMTSASAPAGSAGVLGGTASTDPTAAGVIGQNTGGGPGLAAVVNSGVAPLSVNSSTKVNNLNADLLDGLNGSDLLQNGGVDAASLAPVGNLGTDAAPHEAVPVVIHRTVAPGTLNASQSVDVPIFDNSPTKLFVADAWVVGISPVVSEVDWSLHFGGGGDEISVPASLALLAGDIARVASFSKTSAAEREVAAGGSLDVHLTNTRGSSNSPVFEVYVLVIPSS